MTSIAGAEFFPLSSEDVEIIKWTLYTAVSWNSPPGLPPLAQAVEHPELARYHQEWGRTGDLGVRASIDGQLAGAAFARLFTDDDHGHGYIDDRTPELSVAVAAEFRSQGLGRELMTQLEHEARRHRIARLALSVNNPNPAKRLYEGLGYRTVEDDGVSSTMVLDLDQH